MHDNRRNVLLAVLILALIWYTIPASRYQTVTSYIEKEAGSHPADHDATQHEGISKQPDLNHLDYQQEQHQEEQSQQQVEPTTSASDIFVGGKEKATLLMLARYASTISGGCSSFLRLLAGNFIVADKN